MKIIKRLICWAFGHNYVRGGKGKMVCLNCEDSIKIKGKPPVTVGISEELLDKYGWRK